METPQNPTLTTTTKQKSCTPCVKAKRKCGQQLPRCTRCAKKNTPCHYPNNVTNAARAPNDITATIPGLEFSWLDGLLFGDGSGGGSSDGLGEDAMMGRSLPWSGELQPQLAAAASTGGLGSNTTASTTTDSYSNSSVSGRSKTSGPELRDAFDMMPVWDGAAVGLQPEESSVSDLSRTTDSADADFSIQQIPADAPLSVIGDEPDYLQVTTERDGESGMSHLTLSQSQTNAALHSFRTWPEKWVKEGKAPFIHPRLYSPEMPKPLQDAYAACAIYSVKTTQNEAIAFVVIESKANELVRSYDETKWTPLDLLAAVQALIIFQFIRLFDGDIRQRAQAEDAQRVLQAWADELEVKTISERAFATDTAPSWRSWIFAESVRRTLIMSLNLAGVYSYLFHGYCTLGPKMKTLTFTAQRWLWEAKSSLEWDRVKHSRAPYWIARLEFDQMLLAGQEDELDEFGVMMLIMTKGQDHFDDWVVSKHFTRPSVEDLHLGKTLTDLVKPLEDSTSITVN